MNATTMRSIDFLCSRVMKCSSLLALLLAVGSCSCTAQLKDSVSVKSDAPRRNAVVAVALSMLMPGAGQLYNGEDGKAALHFGLFAGSVTWAALRDIGPTNADIKPVDWLSVSCVGAAWLWAAIDAGVSAGSGARSTSGVLPPESTPMDQPHLSLSTFAFRGSAGISLIYRF